MIDYNPDFIKLMRENLKEDFDAFFETLSLPHFRGLRCRNRKTLSFIRPNNEKIAWCSNACYIDLSDNAGQSPLHEAGAYYIQEPSAMIAASILMPKKGELVLDLCAAPGGKSTQLAMLMENEGTLVANEIHPARAQILSRNIERMGVANCIVTNASPEGLSKNLENIFDKILVDAPCSGEGMFRKNPDARKEWTAESPYLCAERQLNILDEAQKMLKSGGYMLYSTCTFNKIENDDVINKFLDEHKNFSLEKISFMNKSYDMLHVYPHLIKGEGHFFALLKKIEGDNAKPYIAPFKKASFTEANNLLSENLNENIKSDYIFKQSYVKKPEHNINFDRITVLRYGLHLARQSEKHIVLDHALSHVHLLSNRIQLSVDEAIAYIAGNTIDTNSKIKGWVSVCYEDFCLGFGKISDEQVKNHYPKGLRRNLRFENILGDDD